MSPHSARSPLRRPSWPDTTASESHESTGDSVPESKRLLPFARNASAASFTHSDSSESVSDPPQEFSSQPAVLASISTCQNDENDTQIQDQVQKHLSLQQRIKTMLACEPLLLATVLGVMLGILAGGLIRLGKPSSKAVDLIGFPGEIMLRLLKMLVLPLVAGSMIAGVCSLRGSTSSMATVARWTLVYYATTTVTAVVLGMVLVTVLNPGRGSPLDADVASCAGAQPCEFDHDLPIIPWPVRMTSGPHCTNNVLPLVQSLAYWKAAAPTPATISEAVQRSPLEALLDVARNMFPDNIAAAAVNMNILGVITFSLFFGLCLSTIGDAAEPMVKLVDVFNTVIGKMVTAVLWISPLGIASLIAASICRACDLGSTLGALGLWIVTVLLGLALQGGLLLPAVLWGCTRKSPWAALKGFSQAIVLAFGTSSSSAALPVSMQCAEQMGCQDSIIKFVLPLGATVNMNGTALYEATTVIFIAQAHNVQLGLAEMTVVACTATLAAIGAAAIPSAGLVTMLMVMQAVSLDRFASDLAVILAIDWLLDRCRTAVNVIGDAFAVVLVDSMCKQDARRTHNVAHASGSTLEMF